MVVLATGVTAATGVVAVLADVTVAGRALAALLAVALQVGRLHATRGASSHQ